MMPIIGRHRGGVGSQIWTSDFLNASSVDDKPLRLRVVLVSFAQRRKSWLDVSSAAFDIKSSHFFAEGGASRCEVHVEGAPLACMAKLELHVVMHLKDAATCGFRLRLPGTPGKTFGQVLTSTHLYEAAFWNGSGSLVEVWVELLHSRPSAQRAELEQLTRRQWQSASSSSLVHDQRGLSQEDEPSEHAAWIHAAAARVQRRWRRIRSWRQHVDVADCLAAFALELQRQGLNFLRVAPLLPPDVDMENIQLQLVMAYVACCPSRFIGSETARIRPHIDCSRVFRWIESRAADFIVREASDFAAGLSGLADFPRCNMALRELVCALLRRLSVAFPWLAEAASVNLAAKIAAQTAQAAPKRDSDANKRSASSLSTQLFVAQVHSEVLCWVLEGVEKSIHDLEDAFLDERLACRIADLPCFAGALTAFACLQHSDRGWLVKLETEKDGPVLLVPVEPGQNFGGLIRTACIFFGFEHAQLFTVDSHEPVLAESQIDGLQAKGVMLPLVVHQYCPEQDSFDFVVLEIAKALGTHFSLDRKQRLLRITARPRRRIAAEHELAESEHTAWGDLGNVVALPEDYSSKSQYYHFYNTSRQTLTIVRCPLTEVLAWFRCMSARKEIGFGILGLCAPKIGSGQLLGELQALQGDVAGWMKSSIGSSFRRCGGSVPGEGTRDDVGKTLGPLRAAKALLDASFHGQAGASWLVSTIKGLCRSENRYGHSAVDHGLCELRDGNDDEEGAIEECSEIQDKYGEYRDDTGKEEGQQEGEEEEYEYEYYWEGEEEELMDDEEVEAEKEQEQKEPDETAKQDFYASFFGDQNAYTLKSQRECLGDFLGGSEPVGKFETRPSLSISVRSPVQRCKPDTVETKASDANPIDYSDIAYTSLGSCGKSQSVDKGSEFEAAQGNYKLHGIDCHGALGYTSNLQKTAGQSSFSSAAGSSSNIRPVPRQLSIVSDPIDNDIEVVSDSDSLEEPNQEMTRERNRKPSTVMLQYHTPELVRPAMLTAAACATPLLMTATQAQWVVREVQGLSNGTILLTPHWPAVLGPGVVALSGAMGGAAAGGIFGPVGASIGAAAGALVTGEARNLLASRPEILHLSRNSGYVLSHAPGASQKMYFSHREVPQQPTLEGVIVASILTASAGGLKNMLALSRGEMSRQDVLMAFVRDTRDGAAVWMSCNGVIKVLSFGQLHSTGLLGQLCGLALHWPSTLMIGVLGCGWLGTRYASYALGQLTREQFMTESMLTNSANISAIVVNAGCYAMGMPLAPRLLLTTTAGQSAGIWIYESWRAAQQAHAELKLCSIACDIMGVASDYTAEELHSRWRLLVRMAHPDRNHSPDARLTFSVFTLCNEVLQDRLKSAPRGGSLRGLLRLLRRSSWCERSDLPTYRV